MVQMPMTLLAMEAQEVVEMDVFLIAREEYRQEESDILEVRV